jgi:Fip1 motif
MGRKKRRISATGEEEDDQPPPPPPPEMDASSGTETTTMPTKIAVKVEDESKKEAIKSNYAITSHSGDLVEEDIYVSDGSEDEDDNVEVVLSGSKMGLMRRGLHQPLLVQPNLRQWVKPDTTDGETEGETEEEQRRKEEEELAKLDPAERAARLLAEKQRKLEEAKDSARRLESEENAGRDPCLFSKRTAFDIRFDQIDDKPWERNGDLTDFFNYG